MLTFELNAGQPPWEVCVAFRTCIILYLLEAWLAEDEGVADVFGS